MYQQDVKGKKISSLAGVGMIVLIVLSICAAGLVEQVIAQLTGSMVGSVIVWGLVIAEVFLLLRLGVKEYRYTLTEGRLFIETRYGNSTRIIHDIEVSDMLAIGSEEEIFGKYANGQTYDKVFTKGCGVPASVIAYQKKGETKLLLFQPDGKLKALIEEQMGARQE